MGEKAQRRVPWAALALGVLACLGQFFAWMEVRSAQRAAASASKEVVAAKTGAEDTQGAVYRTLQAAIESVSGNAMACHRRVDSLADAILSLASEHPRARRPARASESSVAPRIIEQASIVRPPELDLPKRKADVSEDDPLAGLLK